MDIQNLIPLDPDCYRCRIDNGGEVVHEMIPAGDGLKWGMMIADITQGTPHFHRHTTEQYVVLEGTLILTMDGVDQRVQTGESVSVPPGVVHCARTAGDLPCRVAGFTFPPWTPEDHILVEENT